MVRPKYMIRRRWKVSTTAYTRARALADRTLMPRSLCVRAMELCGGDTAATAAWLLRYGSRYLSDYPGSTTVAEVKEHGHVGVTSAMAIDQRDVDDSAILSGIDLEENAVECLESSSSPRLVEAPSGEVESLKDCLSPLSTLRELEDGITRSLKSAQAGADAESRRSNFINCSKS